MNDAESAVYLLKNNKPWATVDYGVLTELNTQPRTSYLERIENPNPALRGGGAA
jgi:molybdopterin-containing oxidoreductase family iron-sulfur binding subunit